jgi:hypothetical protein
MSKVRLFVAWLLLAALPLQGLAGASMLLCGPAPAQAATATAHDHASHDHEAMGHEGQTVAGAQEDHASNGAEGHACPICAACCNLVALPQAPSFQPEAGRLLTPPLPGPARVLTRAAPAPEKPPRA